MKSQTITIDDISIAYYQTNPERKTKVFMLHGNSNSMNLWKQQFMREDLNAFDLIGIDLPGHGYSGASNKPLTNYTLIGIAKIIDQAVKILADNCPYFLCGFSLGTNIIAEMLAFKTLAKGIILISPSIVGGRVSPQELNESSLVGEVLYSSEVSECKLQEYIKLSSFQSEETQFYIRFKEDFRRCDPVFRKVLIESALAGVFADEIELVNASNIPCLIIYGDQDKIVNTTVYMQNDLFTNLVVIKKISGGNHYLPVENADELSLMFLDFLNNVSIKDLAL